MGFEEPRLFALDIACSENRGAGVSPAVAGASRSRATAAETPAPHS